MKQKQTLKRFTELVLHHVGRLNEKDGGPKLTGGEVLQRMTMEERGAVKTCSANLFELLALILALHIANPGVRLRGGKL